MSLYRFDRFLLVREAGKMVSKDRFMAEVWRGVPITDEALTQCIKTLRKQLADEAANPRFIETVPKHGYRFLATVTAAEGVSRTRVSTAPVASRDLPLLGVAGALGGAGAGIIGGLLYGFASASQPPAAVGALSVLLVLMCFTSLVALLGGRLMAGSLDMMARSFPDSRFRLDRIGALLGEDGFGPVSHIVTGALEGALFGGCIIGAMPLAKRGYGISAKP
jgi:hypothetical protein